MNWSLLCYSFYHTLLLVIFWLMINYLTCWLYPRWTYMYLFLYAPYLPFMYAKYSNQCTEGCFLWSHLCNERRNWCYLSVHIVWFYILTHADHILVTCYCLTITISLAFYHHSTAYTCFVIPTLIWITYCNLCVYAPTIWLPPTLTSIVLLRLIYLFWAVILSFLHHLYRGWITKRTRTVTTFITHHHPTLIAKVK